MANKTYKQMTKAELLEAIMYLHGVISEQNQRVVGLYSQVKELKAKNNLLLREKRNG